MGGGLHSRGAELPLCDVALHGAVSSAGVLLTNQRRRVACSVDADRFGCRRRSGNAGVDADDWSMAGSDRVSPRNYNKVALPLSVIPHVLSLLI